MHKTSISIISQEGRQKIVPWEFSKVISIKLSSPQLHLPSTRMPAISKIVEYAHYHSYNSQVPTFASPIQACSINEIVKNEWDCKFFNSLNIETLIEMINTCEFLGYKSLSAYCQAYLAILFKTLNIEELKQAFQVEEEFNDSSAEKDLELYLKND